MAVCGIVCTKSYEYASGNRGVVGTQRLIVPSPDTSITGGSSAVIGDKWADAVTWMGGSGYTTIRTDFFQPDGIGWEAPKPMNDPFTVCRVNVSPSDIEELYNAGIRKIIYTLQDTSTGKKDIVYVLNAPIIDSGGNRHIASATVEFYLDDVLKFSQGNTGSTLNYVQENNTTVRADRSDSTLPWIFTNDGNEYIGGFLINASYKKELNVGHGWFNTTNECIAGYWGSNDPARIAEFKEWLNGYVPPEYTPTNPFEPGGTTQPYDPSSPDWKPGNFSDESDDPLPDELPDETQFSANASKFITLFKPTLQQLQDLAGLFWNATFAGAIRNFVENITDMFISLAIVPFDVPNGNNVNVTWFGISTGVTLRLAGQQYLDMPMGDIDLSNDIRAFTSNSALDYSPYSQLGIYLPFVGYRELDIDECRDATISLKYRIDLLSGECVAIIIVGGRALYEFTGNCLSSIPITSQSMDSLIGAVLNVAIAGAAGAESAIASAGADGSRSQGGVGEESSMHQFAHKNVAIGAGDALLSATANNAMAIKPRYSKSGSVSGAASMLSVLQPYLYLKTPRQAIPSDYEKYCGFPSNITERLGNLSGYTVVEDIRLNGLVGTSAEIAEIYELLKKGVII